MTSEVEVVGLGVAGSVAALRLAEEGFKVTAYDPLPRYEKPCGEQVTLEPQVEEIVREAGVIKTVVRRVGVLIDGVPLTEVELKGSPKWAIIDKPRLVSALREEAVGLGVSLVRSAWRERAGNVVVDARGPYGVEAESSILAVRVIARVRGWDPEAAWLDFRPSSGGLLWVFPYDSGGRMVNAGLGFMGARDVILLRSLLDRYLRERVGPTEVVDFRGAPIAVFARPTLFGGRSFRVGEAAGLVMAWSGEGNRPAILSSMALARALAEAGTDDMTRARALYSDSLSSLVRMAAVSRALTLLAISYRSSSDLMRGMPRWFWQLYVRQELTPNDVIRALAEGLRGATSPFWAR